MGQLGGGHRVHGPLAVSLGHLSLGLQQEDCPAMGLYINVTPDKVLT